MYHEHSRALQDRFDSRRIADRLAEKLLRTSFSDEDRALIARLPFFFLATADAEGRPGSFASRARASCPFLTTTVTACSSAWAT